MEMAVRSACPESEGEIQRTVFAHFAMRGAPGIFAFHPANGGERSPIEAKILKGLGVRAEVPDVIAVHRGQVFALELKTVDGRTTSAQAPGDRESSALRALMPRSVMASIARSPCSKVGAY